MTQVDIAAPASRGNRSDDPEKGEDALAVKALHAAEPLPAPASAVDGKRKARHHAVHRTVVAREEEERETGESSGELIGAVVIPTLVERERNGEGRPVDKEVTPGIDDRAFALAMVAGSPVMQPGPHAPQKTTERRPVRPKSRAECERRFGTGCRCDPDSEEGCRGAFCRW